MTHLDLCSGIGGFALAAQWAGFQTVGFAEVDPYCGQLLKERFPLVPNYGDLRRADFSQLRGHVTVLSAGVPCQSASVAGKRRGAADDRWLWPAVLDVVERVRPAFCLFENPDGILSLDEFGGILLRLGALGYQVRMFRVPANAVGAKHRRYRVFIVAHAERERRDGRADGWAAETRAGASAQSAGTGGNAETLADTASGVRQRETLQSSGYAAQRGETLADANQSRSQRRDQRQWAYGYPGSGSQSEFGNWKLESQLCGMANGFPSRLDLDFWRTTEMPHPINKGERHRAARLKALGNSIVPQQVYPFFAAIALLYSSLEDALLLRNAEE